MRKIATVCLLLLIATAASADTVDTYLHAEMANQRIPGVAVAVLRDGKPVSVRTLGVANIELNTPVARDTAFKIGSVSKQFIATGIMLLVRDGKVRLDDPVKTYLDDAPAARFEFQSDAMILHEGEGQDRPAKRLTAAASKKPMEEALAAGRRLREQRAATGGEAMLRRVLSSVASGKPDYAAMTAGQAKDVRGELPELRTTLSALGALKAVRFQKVLESGIDHYVLEFENGTADTAIELDRDGRLSGWWMQRR